MYRTKQNQIILSVVEHSHDHPSAEMVVARCREIKPSINIATVYRNLHSLINEGKIRRIVVDGGDRFDKTLHAHSHYKCSKCGLVGDVDGVDVNKLLKIANKSGVGDISGVEIMFNGICQNCKNN